MLKKLSRVSVLFLCIAAAVGVLPLFVYSGGDYSAVPTAVSEAAVVSAPPFVSAASAILIEAGSGMVIYEKAAHERRTIASTTKIMTGIVALENSDLSCDVVVSEKAVGVEGSSIYLYKNEKLSMEDLIYAVLLESANDAAAAVAIEVGGTIETFAEIMNEKVLELGLENTNFTNPHGLDAENHYSTAYDLAVISAYAMKNEHFRNIVSTYKRIIPLKGSEGARLLLNHNKMIKIYDGAIGIKTGFTKKSGRCLVSAAERDGLMLIAVTLNAPDDWNDHRTMLDYGFGKYERVTLSNEGEQVFVMPVVGGETDFIKCRNYGELSAVVAKEHQSITRITEMKRFYHAPINAGDELGRVIYYNNGEIIGTAPIIAEFDVKSSKKDFSLWRWFLGLF